jgi:hypothetical protein
MSNDDFDRLKFPSGRAVGNCRKDAKALVRERGISLSEALDEVARANGATKPWHHALADLRSAGPIIVPVDPRDRPMTSDDVRAVMEKHFELTHFGIGPNSQNMKDAGGQYGRAIERGQAQLLARLDECNRALTFLRHVEPRKTINRKMSSYGLKHTAEGFLRSLTDPPTNAYVANGAFICAALHRGFEMKRTHVSSPNVHFNISLKSPVFEWRRLASDHLVPIYYPVKRARLAELAAQLGAATTAHSSLS